MRRQDYGLGGLLVSMWSFTQQTDGKSDKVFSRRREYAMVKLVKQGD